VPEEAPQGVAGQRARRLDLERRVDQRGQVAPPPLDLREHLAHRALPHGLRADHPLF